MRNLFDTFFEVTSSLERSGIPYAIIGGFAMAFHDVVRATRDIDFLVLSPDIEQCEAVLLQLGLRSSGRPFRIGTDPSFTFYRFVTFRGNDYVMAAILCSDDPRIEEIVRESIRTDSEFGPVRIARRQDLIWLKEQRLSDQDRVDIDRLRNERDDKD